jgi:hypothetical protein
MLDKKHAMWYHHTMPFTSPDIQPADVKVTMNMRVTLAYRNQLVATAREQRISINSLLIDAISTVYPEHPTG